jgi:hypothetical protein
MKHCSEQQTQPEPNESNCAGLLESADTGAEGRDTLDNPNADSAIIAGDEYDNSCSSDDDVATGYRILTHHSIQQMRRS